MFRQNPTPIRINDLITADSHYDFNNKIYEDNNDYIIDNDDNDDHFMSVTYNGNEDNDKNRGI